MFLCTKFLIDFTLLLCKIDNQMEVCYGRQNQTNKRGIQRENKK